MKNDGSHDAAQRGQHLSFLLSRYWKLFGVALLATAAFLLYKLRHAKPEVPKSGQVLGEDHASLGVQLEWLLRYLPDNLHPAPGIPETVVQIALVVLVTWLWFYTFRAAAQIQGLVREGGSGSPVLPWYLRLRVPPSQWVVPIPLTLGAISTVPALVFAASMYQAYQPAVFVMALVAVFVAAEHYGGLREQAEQLTEQLEQLEKQREALKKTREDLDRTLESLKEIRQATDTLLNFEGLAKFKANVYGKYSRADEDITAVIRFHDVDREWWACGREKPELAWGGYLEQYGKKAAPQAEDPTQKKPGEGKDDASQEGLLECPADEKKNTLLEALTSFTYRASTTFVCDLPLPLSGKWKKKNPEELFRDLLGITWQLVVLEEARKLRMERNRLAGVDPMLAKPIQAFIASPSSWMHVIDQVVYQVIWRDELDESSVRELTAEMKDSDLRRTTCTWAREDIQRYASRGCRAEEYVVAVLRYTALGLAGERQIIEDQVFNEGHELYDVLDELGMCAWLRSAVKELAELGDQREELGKDLCVAVFRKFLLQRCASPALSISPSDRVDPIRLKHLALEVL